MKIAVVILNYNGAEWLKKFLPTVIEYSPSAQIVVIENASTDSSLTVLKEYFPTVKVILNDNNYGFAGGYNEGLKKVDAELFVLLNSDVEVTPNWLTPMVDFFQNNEQCAAAQPKILAHHNKTLFEHAGASGGYIDTFGYPFCRGRIFELVEEDTGQYNTTEQIFWASGACLFIKSKHFWEVGGFDAAFFAHMEEIDLCWRLHNHGYSIFCIPESIIYHVGGGTLNYNSPRKTFLNFRNSLFTLHKNLDSKVFLTIFTRLSLDGITGARMLFKGEFKHIWSILKAHFSYYKHISYLNQQRKKIPKKTFKQLPGTYGKSIVWSYFVKKQTKFSQLLFSK
jgi:GT2 family glycosyltransferase